MENVYAQTHESVADAHVDVRQKFIKKTYMHLGLAVLAFTFLEFFLFQSGIAQRIVHPMVKFGWLPVLGVFMLVSWVADKWARSNTSKGLQYGGLFIYIIAQALIFVPLIYLASQFSPEGTIAKAGVVTGITFGGLTLIPFMTKKDFSFIGGTLRILSFAALGLIVASVLFGFDMGNLFAFAMVGLAAGYILYYTSNIMHHYHPDQYVAASLALFASVALLFWYILQIFMSRD